VGRPLAAATGLVSVAVDKLAVVVVALSVFGCETAEQVEFGDPAKVAGGFTEDATDPAADCVVNNACGVSWENRIYAQIFVAPLDGPTPSGGCSELLCHAGGAGGLRIPSDSASETYFQITNYDLVGDRAYIVRCHPELSHLMCNLRLAAGVDNPYVGDDQEFTGGCGSPMPKPDENVAAKPLNQDQLEDIAEWIACGAPQN
jgi:hypothetical protein